MRSISKTVLAMAAVIPFGASAQTSDADYCRALMQKYETYIANMSYGMSPMPDAIDGRVAVEQCKAGNPAAGIPVLEKKLRNARIDLPPRG